jgi:hypothetical protein
MGLFIVTSPYARANGIRFKGIRGIAISAAFAAPLGRDNIASLDAMKTGSFPAERSEGEGNPGIEDH